MNERRGAPVQRSGRAGRWVARLAVLIAGVVVAQHVNPRSPELGTRLLAVGDESSFVPGRGVTLTTGHGWAVLPSSPPGTPSGAIDPSIGDLVHIVPADGSRRATPGSVRPVTTLVRHARAAAASNGSLHLWLDGENVNVGSIVKVSARFLGNGSWDYAPTGRLEAIGTVPAGVIPRSVVSASFGVAAVWTRPPIGETPSGTELGVLHDFGWSTVPFPPDLKASPSELDAHLFVIDDRLVLAARDTQEPRLRVWSTAIEREVLAPAAPEVRSAPNPPPIVTIRASWSPVTSLALPAYWVAQPIRVVGPDAPDWLLHTDGQWVLAHRESPGLTLHRLTPSGATVLARVAIPTACVGVIGVSGDGAGGGRVRVIGVSPATVPSATPATGAGVKAAPPSTLIDPASVRVIDLSISTGRVLHDGPAHTDGLFTRRDFSYLWLAFLVVGAVMLFFVMRTEVNQPVTLPEGACLATPLRRTLAAILDAAAAVVIVALVTGRTPGQWAAELEPGAGGLGLVPLFLVVAVAVAHTSVAEAATGRSVGKALAGISVIAMRRGTTGNTTGVWSPARLGFGGAFLRNLVRWCFPPLGMVMFFDSQWRHIGDQLARSVVIMPDDEEDDDTDG